MVLVCAPHPKGSGCLAPPPFQAQPSPASLAPGSQNTQAPPPFLPPHGRGLFLPLVLSQVPGGLDVPDLCTSIPFMTISLLMLLSFFVKVLVFSRATSLGAP